MGSPGSSTRIREERRSLQEVSGKADRGSGDRDRDVERELAPERDGRTGMWMVLDRRREARLWPDHWLLDDAALSRLRGLTVASGGGVALLAGLAVPADNGRLVIDLFSRGKVDCRRKEAGL